MISESICFPGEDAHEFLRMPLKALIYGLAPERDSSPPFIVAQAAARGAAGCATAPRRRRRYRMSSSSRRGAGAAAAASGQHGYGEGMGYFHSVVADSTDKSTLPISP